MQELTTTAIIVMDVAEPESLEDNPSDYNKFYYQEQEANEAFIRYLNIRLNELKSQGAKIIDSTYVGEVNKLIDVEFDEKIITLQDLKKFIIKNNITHLVYTGMHYNACVYFTRPTSAAQMTSFVQQVSVAVQLTRALPYTYFNGIMRHSQYPNIVQILL